MIVEVAIPQDAWAAGEEGVVATWLVRDGERVEPGAILAELMYEKTSIEVTAPAAGTLSILVPAEIPVRGGQVIARIQVL